MSHHETERRAARFDYRAAAAAAVMFGVLGGGAESRQADKPAADDAPRAIRAPRAADAGDLPRLPETAPARVAAPRPAPRDVPAPVPAPTTRTAEPRDVPAPVPAPAPASVPSPAASPAPAPAPAAAVPAGLPGGFGPLSEEEVRTLRDDATARLKELAPGGEGAEKVDPDPARKVADKALAELLEARLRKLDDLDKLAADLAEAARPEADPARKIAEAKAEVADLETRLKQPIESLVPPLFRGDGPVDQASRDQMKEVIAAARKDVADYQEKIAALPVDPEKEAKAAVAAQKAERDKIAQNLDAIKARAEALASAPEAKTAVERRQAKERAIDVRVEAAAETLRLHLADRKLDRTATAAEAVAADRTRWIAHVKLASRMLEPMETRFRAIAEAREHDLQRQAQTEQARADREREPIARYRAGRLAELLDLEAMVVKTEQLATVSIAPSLEDMRKQAGIASANFARIKQLVEGDEKRAGRIDVFHINADYKRLQPERRRIEREERATVAKRLTDYANLLASVELNQIEDALLDQIDLDDLLDKLPATRHAEATTLWREMEVRHTDLLKRRREALEQLVRREQATLDEIDRRLAILEEETSFIRTHLFWVRDQDPIGTVTVSLAAGETRRLIRVAVGLARGTAMTTGWKAASPEFLAASAVVALLPLGIFRVRRALKRRLTAMLPPPAKTEAATGLVVDMNPVTRQARTASDRTESN